MTGEGTTHGDETMKSVMDRLEPELDHNDDPVYAAADIRRVASEVVELGDTRQLKPGDAAMGLLAVCWELDKEPGWVEVALFQWQMGPGSDGSDAMYSRVMHGGGPSHVLRELRHTYWGEPDNAGYIFYPHADLIIGALTALKRWFDLD